MSQWENLTAFDFKKEVIKSQRVCVLPVGVIERHGDHLPLGTDTFCAHKIACLAAEIERAVVFPFYYFAQTLEASANPGAIAFPSRFSLELLENVCEEIGRNGFKKIMILNGHGGNGELLGLFVRSLLGKKKNYIVYYPTNEWKAWEDMCNKYGIHEDSDHAAILETSLMMAVNRDIVKKTQITKPILSLKRLKHLENIQTPVAFYANFPGHSAGDPRKASEKLGKELLDRSVKYTAELIRVVKKDKAAEKLYNEFFTKTVY